MQRKALGSLLLLLVGCAETTSAPDGHTPLSQPTAALVASVTTIDLSNGSDLEGSAFVISNSGIVLGKLNGRGWWQAPSPVFTRIDDGYLIGGNRSGDAAGSQDHALLATNGGAPFTDVTVLRPPGTPGVVVRDINGSRAMVGSTLGSAVYAIRWETPTASPTALPVPTTQYPVQQLTASAISDNGLMVGYALETTGKNSSRYEALLWSGGSVAILPLAPGAVSQLASNVNDAGVISGYISNGSGSFPVRWSPRPGGGYDIAVLNLASPGNIYTGLNSCGQVSGGTNSGAFVWDGVSAPIMLPSINPSVSPSNNYARDLDDFGNVVGTSAAARAKGRTILRPTLWTGLPGCPQ